MGAGFFPLDAELGLLPNHRFTPRVEEVVARLGTSVPFAEAAALLRSVLGVHVSEATQRRLTYAAGGAAVAVEDAEVARIEREVPAVAGQPERMQLSVDATKVPLVGGTWTDAKLAVIADLAPAMDADGQPAVEAVNLSYVARWEPAEVFARTLTGEAQRRGLEAARDLASPNDGADWIQGVLDHMAPHAVRILDEPHAAEHLGTIGALVYGEHSAAATAWTQRQRTRLLKEEPEGVLAELRRVLAQGPHPQAPPGPDGLTPADYLAREVTYFHTRGPDWVRRLPARSLPYRQRHRGERPQGRDQPALQARGPALGARAPHAALGLTDHAVQ